MAGSFFIPKGQADAGLAFKGDSLTIEDVLLNFGNEIQEKLRESLRNKVSQGTTKALEQSILFDVTNDQGVWRFRLDFNKYGDYLDQGVQGYGGTVTTDSKHYPNRKKGDNWVNKAPASPFRFREKKPKLINGQGISLWAYTKGLNPFAVQNVVWRQGIKATNWFSEVATDEVVADLRDDLEKAGAKNIEIYLTSKLEGEANGE